MTIFFKAVHFPYFLKYKKIHSIHIIYNYLNILINLYIISSLNIEFTYNLYMIPQQLPQESLVPLMVAQLKSYGYYAIARSLADQTALGSIDPSVKLAELCANFTQIAPEQVEGDGEVVKVFEEPTVLGNYSCWFTTQHRYVRSSYHSLTVCHFLILITNSLIIEELVRLQHLVLMAISSLRVRLIQVLKC